MYSISSGCCCFAPWKISASVQGSHKADSEKEGIRKIWFPIRKGTHWKRLRTAVLHCLCCAFISSNYNLGSRETSTVMQSLPCISITLCLSKAGLYFCALEMGRWRRWRTPAVLFLVKSLYCRLAYMFYSKLCKIKFNIIYFMGRECDPKSIRFYCWCSV